MTLLDRLLWTTTLRYWTRDGDGETYVYEQRHRLMPWRWRRGTATWDDREVTA